MELLTALNAQGAQCLIHKRMHAFGRFPHHAPIFAQAAQTHAAQKAGHTCLKALAGLGDRDHGKKRAVQNACEQTTGQRIGNVQSQVDKAHVGQHPKAAHQRHPQHIRRSGQRPANGHTAPHRTIRGDRHRYLLKSSRSIVTPRTISLQLRLVRSAARISDEHHSSASSRAEPFFRRGEGSPGRQYRRRTTCPAAPTSVPPRIALSAIHWRRVPMRVRVLFFGMLKDVAGKSNDWLDLPDSASVGDVLAHYQSQLPRFKDSLPSLAVAVNQHYSSPETKLKPDDEVALLPPVSGGSGQAGGGTPAAEPPGRRRYASIVRTRIDTQQVLAGLKRGEDGAAVVFEGIVRNQTRGRKTLYLDYEAYEEMALQQMEALAEQSLKQFQIRDVALDHRLGRLEIGETSVLVVVASAHRAAAFDACRWLIDTLKRTVPIWKKEYFEDGAVWADGEVFPEEIRGGRGSLGREGASK